MANIYRFKTEDSTFLVSSEESQRISKLIAYDIDTGRLPEFALSEIEYMAIRDIYGETHPIDPYKIISCTKLNANG